MIETFCMLDAFRIFLFITNKKILSGEYDNIFAKQYPNLI